MKDTRVLAKNIVEGTSVLSETQEFNEELKLIISTMITDAVKHFSKRFRASDDYETDEVYLYTQEQVDAFCNLNKNPDVKIKIIYDNVEPHKVFAYCLHR